MTGNGLRWTWGLERKNSRAFYQVRHQRWLRQALIHNGGMRGQPSDLLIAWADPRIAASYRASDLSADDARRAALPRSTRAQRDWQASRALLHSVRTAADDQVCSLSHKHGHAVCAVAPAGWRIGVDLERIVPRNVMRLADWVCTPQEQNMLARMDTHRRLAHFYMLWTLKEAFIKAANLAFPADMARVGLAAGEAGVATLRTPPGRWQACAWRLAPDWMVSMVWQAPTATGQSPHWHAPARCALPPRVTLGQWHTA